MLSLVFWTLTVVVSIKYVVLIMRADNNGEGGIIALMALASQAVRDARAAPRLSFVGIFGAALFFGDGVITPAISVLVGGRGPARSRRRGCTLGRADHARRADRPVHVQRYGTERVGKLFGPVMVVWFVVIAVLGLVAHRRQPGDAEGAVARTTRCCFLFTPPGDRLLVLGSVVLCVTGAEALYADMGHFGKRPIRLAWFGFVDAGADAQLLRPGRAAARRPEQGRAIRSSRWRRRGRSIR